MNFPKVVIKYAYKLILYRRKVYSSPFFPSWSSQNKWNFNLFSLCAPISS
jgi:hypothetical protein